MCLYNEIYVYHSYNYNILCSRCSRNPYRHVDNKKEKHRVFPEKSVHSEALKRSDFWREARSSCNPLACLPGWPGNKNMEDPYVTNMRILKNRFEI